MQILKRIAQFFLSVSVVLAAGRLGSLVTTPNIESWYEPLAKPPLVPPNEVFGPVWIFLYLLIGIALFLVWIAPKKEQGWLYVSFFAQLILNTAWSFAFFGARQPWLGVVVIGLLVAAIIWTIQTFRMVSKPAALLMMPYLFWVLFATYLTVGVALLN